MAELLRNLDFTYKTEAFRVDQHSFGVKTNLNLKIRLRSRLLPFGEISIQNIKQFGLK
jgi:hypothetical protein